DSATKEAGSRQAWFEAMHGDQGTPSSSEWLARRAEAMKQRQSDMAAVSAAYSKLYEALTPEQRSVLDQQRVAFGPRYGGPVR
ncbi:MAG TPA: Spy/CpxP family protein refolding chaperone, partial [Casimicrobiaceae bacterium]|nr:Spy/CpxP family protein refolding chaperone [Casimicrobiaceae bacterium]